MYCQEAIDGNWANKDEWITAPDGTSQYRYPLPDYPSDLNAVRELEARLTDRQHADYRGRLATVVTNRDDTALRLMSQSEYRAWFSASAVQRCEALCKTLGLREGDCKGV